MTRRLPSFTSETPPSHRGHDKGTMKHLIILILAMLQRISILLLALVATWFGYWPLAVFFCFCAIALDVPREK